jgi:hypothetical protein
MKWDGLARAASVGQMIRAGTGLDLGGLGEGRPPTSPLHPDGNTEIVKCHISSRFRSHLDAVYLVKHIPPKPRTGTIALFGSFPRPRGERTVQNRIQEANGLSSKQWDLNMLLDAGVPH